MNKLLKILLPIFLSIICTSCSIFYFDSMHINVEKLYSQKEKYGIVVFRPIYFKHGYNDSLQGGLFVGSIVARPMEVSRRLTEVSDYCMGCRRDISGKVLNEKMFWVDPNAKDARSTSFKPEAFYGITMMPAGDYFIRCILLDMHYVMGSLNYLSLNDANKYHFHVTAGRINYIGDLYVSHAAFMKTGGPFSWDKYSAPVRIYDRYLDAQSFMRKFYPEINLPFIKNIIIDTSKT